MKKWIISVLLAIGCTFTCFSQQDTALANRLNKVLKHTEKMELDQVLDYTYPKLFTIATRQQMKEIMQSSFETDEFSSTLDSVLIDTVFPVFTVNNEQFAKIKHSMIMRMKFKEPADTSESADMDMMTELMEGQFGKGNVRYDKKVNTIVILMNSDMVAIRTKEDQKWYFLNIDEDNPAMMDFMLSKEVQKKLKEYN